MAGQEKAEMNERGLTKLELVFLVITVAALGLSSVMFTLWHKADAQNDTLVERVSQLDRTVHDYHDQFRLNQLEFNAINTGLNIRRHEVAQFRDQRDKNWSRLVGVCTELRVRGHDNAACRGIE
ncbi:hypothetical protein LMG33818_000902 [Halomonadaceae bacterium LMG 33818]|uniref:hypothetical protein n=1 Tax=Cernens ardua TaxID=3402176 RepID=UPI003EDC9712